MTSTHVTGVVRFGDIDWRALGANVHPVDLILDRGFSVYCGVDRNLFMVVKYHHQIASAPNPNRDPFLAPPPVEFPYIGLDDELNLLRLDDATLEDLRMLGVAKVRDFISGGLAFCRVPQPDNGTSPTPMFKEVVFDKCHLFDKAHWTEVRRSRLHVLRPWDLPQQVTDILLDDVYLEASDVASIILSPATSPSNPETEECSSASTDPLPGQVWERYPLAAGGHELPTQLLWLYRGALAIRDKTLESTKEAITSWLRTVPPEGTFGRTRLTAVNFLNPQYRYADALNDSALEQWPNAAELKALGYMGSHLRCTLGIYHAWLAADEGRLADRWVRFATKLLQLGFTKSSSEHVIEMISGRKLKEEDKIKRWAVVDLEINNLAIAKAKHSRAVANMAVPEQSRTKSTVCTGETRPDAEKLGSSGLATKPLAPTL